MSYYFSKALSTPFDECVDTVTARLKEEGFGILTRIDVQETLKQKLNVAFPRYTILGACNPSLAHQALQAESKIGTMLPCNVIVREDEDGRTEVAAVDPVASMQAIENPALEGIASSVQAKLRDLIDRLQ